MLNMADLSQELAAEAEAAENELTSDAAMIEVEVREQVEESNVVEEVQTEEIGSVLVGPVDRDLSELELLKAHLDRLAAEEAYEEAARIRDQIIQMEDESAS